MNRGMWMGIIAVAVVGVGWYLFRPERLWVNQRVNESLPVATSTSGFATGAAQAGTMPASEDKALLEGQFHSGSHETHGTATLYRLQDGQRVLRFTNFETSNGPDVQVLLVQAADAKDNSTVTRSGYVRLAALKGNVGDQNYAVPAEADLAKYRAVTIWCRRFGVNFGTAPLTAIHT